MSREGEKGEVRLSLSKNSGTYDRDLLSRLVRLLIRAGSTDLRILAQQLWPFFEAVQVEPNCGARAACPTESKDDACAVIQEDANALKGRGQA
ncbi:hypothetical protein Ciccas_001635 [Cichlidogyrus casuarinus]|uniref:Uncharacterized protein n=1 Tax=Cichlidogyrus casuarinus TaxID=1844966 RepID=A0ABD2QJK3_9PLAT